MRSLALILLVLLLTAGVGYAILYQAVTQTV